MKFSIIVPVYNVEDYVLKCLKSINDQSYDNYEVIVVNDGATDNSENIIKKYIKNKNKFKYYKKTNGGLSDARNYGLDYVTGDYLLFVDSDDYLNKDLLLELKKEISVNHPDVCKININFEKDNDIRKMVKNNFNNLSSDEAIPKLLADELFEPAWLYCYNYKFWQKNKFMYAKGRIHEDFGLTPLILINAKNISSIDYPGYNYIIREGSIMNNKNPEKDFKKFSDCLYFLEENIVKIMKCKNINAYTKKLLCSYYANGVYNRLKLLKNDYYKKALALIKEKRIYDYLMDDTLKRKIKKFCYKHCLFIK